MRNLILGPQLEKTHETPLSSRDEGLFSCMARKTIPSHLSKLHRRLHSLYATQWAPRDTRRDSTGERSPFFPLKTRPYSPGPTLQGPCDRSQKWRGTLRFLPQLEKRPSSIEPNSVVSREAPPNTRVSLNSQRLPEKLPEVTGTSRGNPGVPAATQERPRESFFNAS